MIDIELLNEKLQKEFNEDKNCLTLERYVMSELLSPIEDYFNAIDLIRGNIKLIEGLNLYYIAAYLSAELLLESNEFLERLNNIINMVNNKDKAIIYYLNAYSMSCTMNCLDKNKNYGCNLLKSIEFSKNNNFVNNRFDFAKILEGKEANNYLKDAFLNVEIVETKETLNSKTINYWLSSQRFVNEFILGTHLSQETYCYKFKEFLTS